MQHIGEILVGVGAFLGGVAALITAIKKKPTDTEEDE